MTYCVSSITCDGMTHVFATLLEIPVMITEIRTFPIETTTVTCIAMVFFVKSP